MNSPIKAGTKIVTNSMSPIKGPWRIINYIQLANKNRGFYKVVTCHDGSSVNSETGNWFTACLIAAAPELLEALESVLEYAEMHQDSGPEGEGWQSKTLKLKIEKAKSVLNKAKGL